MTTDLTYDSARTILDRLLERYGAELDLDVVGAALAAAAELDHSARPPQQLAGADLHHLDARPDAILSALHSFLLAQATTSGDTPPHVAGAAARAARHLTPVIHPATPGTAT